MKHVMFDFGIRNSLLRIELCLKINKLHVLHRLYLLCKCLTRIHIILLIQMTNLDLFVISILQLFEILLLLLYKYLLMP